MGLRLLRRRLAASTPRMSVRSSMPWPLRWLAAATVLGFSAAVALWAFEFGKDIAGLDRHAQEELQQLRREVVRLREDLDAARSVSSAADSLITTERVAQQQLQQQLRALEAENQSLRADLGFFERLLPAQNGQALDIRGLHAEPADAGQWRWQVLVIQPGRQAPDFQGTLEVTLTGTLAGQPWTLSAPVRQPVSIRRYLRQEGIIPVPPQVSVRSVTARVLQGATVRSTQTFAL
ncbi:DUF6776 family protein [Hydrogenophaga sp. R2]|uniref:DUF6776 family protein n=1 Tax=Hydrogenophaga sp. R2 TaxID=3132827 RepID=UPI003CF6F314